MSTRLYALLSVPQVRRMLDTSHNKLDLLDAINRRKTVLVNTAGLGEWTPLFGRVIIALALQAAYRRDIATEPHPALLFVDEAFDLMDEKINTILIRSRKFGLFIRFATQQYEQIPAAVRAAAAANTEVKLAGGLTATDARIIAPDMRTDVDFLLSIAKHEDGTEFACHVQNELQRAVQTYHPLRSTRSRSAPQS